MPVSGGEEGFVVDGLSYSLNFAVADCGLYFVSFGDSAQESSIDFFEFSTGSGRRLPFMESRGGGSPSRATSNGCCFP